MKLQILIALGALSVAGAAIAQPAPSPDRAAAFQAVQTACAADMKTLCADKAGREAFMCLRQNADKASGPCKAALAKMPRRGPGGGQGGGGPG
jgi:hypothetical protein